MPEYRSPPPTLPAPPARRDLNGRGLGQIALPVAAPIVEQVRRRRRRWRWAFAAAILANALLAFVLVVGWEPFVMAAGVLGIVALCVAVIFAAFAPLGYVGYLIASGKEAGEEGFWWGVLFGPIGWIVAAFLDSRPQCPQCLGRVPTGAAVCLHCRTPLRPLSRS